MHEVEAESAGGDRVSEDQVGVGIGLRVGGVVFFVVVVQEGEHLEVEHGGFELTVDSGSFGVYCAAVAPEAVDYFDDEVFLQDTFGSEVFEQ